MSKFSPLIAFTLLAGLFALFPLSATAQDEKQADLERKTYDACWDKDKKDESKCVALCTELT